MGGALRWHDLELGEQLGEGHSGVVLRVRLRRRLHDFDAGELVAVKRYKRWVLEEPGQLERVFREVEVGRSIRHPNLIDVVGALMDDAGTPALVMRYYDGPTLESTLRGSDGGKRTPFDVRFSIIRDIAAALIQLHERNVIHRDVKPANIILTTTGAVLGDFGVVRSGAWPEQTTTGAFLGTIRYAAPEYLFGDDYDQRIDLYSLGAIAYELLVGQTLHSAHTHWAKLVAAKAASITERLAARELMMIERRTDYRTAAFARDIIDHSRCEVGARDLDLESLVTALDDKLWFDESWIDHGQFRRGTRPFNDRFRNAHEAAEYMVFNFTNDELTVLRKVLRESRWKSSIKPYEVSAELYDKMLRHKLIDDRSTSGRMILPGSLLEAVALNFI